MCFKILILKHIAFVNKTEYFFNKNSLFYEYKSQCYKYYLITKLITINKYK